MTTTPPIVFFDLDGVLSSSHRDEDSLPVLVPSRVALLNAIAASQPSTRLVMSSSWRNHISDLHAYGRRNGLAAPFANPCSVPNIQVVPLGNQLASDSWCRANEVHYWLLRHWPVERFVILDDWPMWHLSSQAVRTDSAVGLTDQDAERAKFILSRPFVPGERCC